LLHAVKLLLLLSLSAVEAVNAVVKSVAAADRSTFIIVTVVILRES